LVKTTYGSGEWKGENWGQPEEKNERMSGWPSDGATVEIKKKLWGTNHSAIAGRKRNFLQKKNQQLIPTSRAWNLKKERVSELTDKNEPSGFRVQGRKAGVKRVALLGMKVR